MLVRLYSGGRCVRQVNGVVNWWALPGGVTEFVSNKEERFMWKGDWAGASGTRDK